MRLFLFVFIFVFLLVSALDNENYVGMGINCRDRQVTRGYERLVRSSYKPSSLTFYEANQKKRFVEIVFRNVQMDLY